MLSGLLVLLAVILSLLFSKLIKIIFFSREETSLLSGGGMPSSHCASAASLASMIFFVEGVTTTFVLALSFAVVVFVDAVRVRRAVGINAKAIQSLAKKSGKVVMVEHGHTVKEAIYGLVLGFGVAVILVLLVY